MNVAAKVLQDPRNCTCSQAQVPSCGAAELWNTGMQTLHQQQRHTLHNDSLFGTSPKATRVLQETQRQAYPPPTESKPLQLPDHWLQQSGSGSSAWLICALQQLQYLHSGQQPSVVAGCSWPRRFRQLRPSTSVPSLQRMSQPCRHASAQE